MKKNSKSYIINCPIHQKQRSLVIEAKRKINHSNRRVEKTIYAEDVQFLAKQLLECDQFEANKEDCKQCHQFATTQHQSVEGVLKVITIG
ncbi:MAG: hypothetical protein WBH71_08970 [Bacteroidales bacterium]|nr:hypothetical protein [Bacteroidales bacterium]MDI9592199.1 hypothetical protein [Bacteroidota bacterium]NLH34278.1 hypothetical protein [Lentimicrobium sp.]MBP7873329.1 hypothetical protein [Bacteroidales bacterium]MCO6468310.1 hypothetical protein [Bacteroidales bacterium]